MIRIQNVEKNNLISATISGKISKEDIEKIHPLIHNIIKNGDKVDFFFELVNFKGFDLKGFWEDLKVDAIHISDYGKMAIVGEKEWQQWSARATDVFTNSEVKYFDLTEKEEAKRWILNQ